jgi:uncharacterized phage protein (TIGR01671 family)
MREIKFRGWSKIDKKILSWKELKSVAGVLNHFDTKEEYDLCIMQFTGLLDKNGRGIYEGDILKLENTLGDKNFYEVFWQNGFGCYSTKPNTSVPLSVWNCYMEIIGNIYETPTLLKGST